MTALPRLRSYLLGTQCQGCLRPAAPSHGQHHSPLVEYQETGASSASKQLPVPGPPVLDPGLTSKTFRTTGEVKMQNQTKSVTQGEYALLRRRGDGGRVQVGGEEGPLPPSHNSTSIALCACLFK